MNKTEFLDELKMCLAVLEEKEQQDILEEYTQHIDMKMERGLSEEEAIGDFGDLAQLAAEILEAYHVNPDYYGNRTVSRKLGIRGIMKRARTGFLAIVRTAGRFLHRTAAAAVRNTCVLFGRIRDFFSRIPARRPRILRHFRTKTNIVTINGADSAPSSESPRTGLPGIPPVPRTGRGDDKSPVQGIVPSSARSTVQRTGASICRGIKGMFCALGVLFSSCLSLAVWCLCFCLRWAWNILLFILAMLNGCLALFTFYLLAVFLVWTVQGYPFAGPALISLGVVLCAGSFSILCISLLRLRRNTGNTALSTATGQNTTEEVQHA